jgi:hypothetical protein
MPPASNPFAVGDLVTLNDLDLYMVVENDRPNGEISVVCVVPPLGWLTEDGMRTEPSYRAGDRLNVWPSSFRRARHS